MKKRKRKRRRTLFLLIIIIIIVYLFYHFVLNTTARELEKLGYSNNAIKLIIDKNIDEYLIDKKAMSKTLEMVLIENKYNKDYIDNYINITYINDTNFVDQLNNLLGLKYNNDEINSIFTNMKSSDINKVIDANNKFDNLSSYINQKYFLIDNLNRYISFKDKNNSYSYEKIITYVNANRDYAYYTHVIDANLDSKNLILVNKYNKLDSDFVPSDLSYISSSCAIDSNKQVLSIVKTNLEKMCNDMKKENLYIKVLSAYRSYSYQNNLYNNYVNRDGKTMADTYSARPGYSEHQTGLAMDIYDKDLNLTYFEDTKEYAWMKNNAHKYGFIIRYPSDKTDITGYKFEPWHYRYVGLDVAKFIYDNNITFDEYYAYYLVN